MATLRFSFGTMGSGKSTFALQIHHNLSSRDLYGLLLTCLDREGDQVTSRLGVAAPAIDVTPDMDLHRLCVRHWPIHYLVCDEAQFYTVKQCDQLARVVDELEVEVYAFGLITDFRGHLFDGTRRLLEIADERVPLQVEARCWCGARATHNAPRRQRRDHLRGRDGRRRRHVSPPGRAAVRRRRALRAAVPAALRRRRPRHVKPVTRATSM